MLATDLDGTLVGDKNSLQDLLTYYKEQTYAVSLIYITGRHFQSALSLMEAEQLPRPDILVTDVGTEIYIGETFEKDREWASRMSTGWVPEQIEAVASRIPGMQKQPLPVTSRCSYYVGNDQQAEEFKRQLDEEGISHKFIYSGGRDVDILPAESGKGQALQYILSKYRLGKTKLLVAGDSGNDRDMLTLGYPSVIVGNAQPELLECPESPLIYRSTKGFAGGIQEAWQHFHS
ncbi:HAD-IIB family hydrolase [Planococcus salinus]|uniref:HAD-IIB family hydrolase n=2 Tax=Planococcus salinus TaxID=1848460 RepID=A0A3M8P5H9_9BACL|nr:HAD-IIB family hydrolase [Planococcus salinus]